VGILVLVHNSSVLELDVEVLVDRVECPANRQVVLKLHRHLLPHELLEVGEEQHGGGLTTLAAAGSADTWRTLVAGKGLGEDVTNGAAARRVVAAREGRAEGSPREGKGLRNRGRR